MLRTRPFLPMLFLAIAACNTDSDPWMEGEIAAAERRWEAAAITHYRIETRQLCFCPGAYDWATLEVRNDTILSVIYAETGDSADVSEWSRRTTVSQAFASIRQSLRHDWKEIELDFDDETGFPKLAQFTPDDDVVDGGTGVAMQNLQVLTPD